ncbi:hypothetical protein P8452_02899 [Trifolium repens]|nr:hypothetical protein P8452_02899 [Trifolium repens]
MSLLAKWRWKLLSREEESWKSVVIARYGNEVIGRKVLGENDVPRLASSWWRDICNMEAETQWFSSAVSKKVGSGDSTFFWDEAWIGNQTLRQRFPRLYGISTQKLETIQRMGSWIDGVWRWNFEWRRPRFRWEEEQFQEFMEMVMQFVPSSTVDTWLWLGEGSKGFTVKDAYMLLENRTNSYRILEPVDRFVFNRLWKSAAPSKVRAFAWQILLGRAPTKINLFKRRMIEANQTNCVVCGLGPETETHLFLHCSGAAKIWCDILRWLGFCLVIPPNLVTAVAMWTCTNDKKDRAGICLIWCAYVWVLWKARNENVFNNTIINLDVVVEQIKVLSWQWFIGRVAKGPCLLYEWIWSPMDCMKR